MPLSPIGSATLIVRQIASGELSAVEVLSAHLDRIASLDRTLNARAGRAARGKRQATGASAAVAIVAMCAISTHRSSRRSPRRTIRPAAAERAVPDDQDERRDPHRRAEHHMSEHVAPCRTPSGRCRRDVSGVGEQ
jgi:hypothetical protein